MELNGKPVEGALGEIFNKIEKNLTSEEANAAQEKINKALESEKYDRLFKSNELAEVPKRFWTARFSDHPDDFTERAKKLCLNPSDRILFLFGNVGRGKTTILCSAIHERAFEGLNGSLYYSILNLEMDLRRCRNFSTDEDEKKFIDRLSSIPFLCIDEVGTCLDPKEEAYFLRRVLCQRYDNQLPTWIATNLSPSSFKALICNVNLDGKTAEERKNICEQLDKENVVLNRIKSVVISHQMVGESFRGVANDDITEVQ